jgi:type I restriction enzyme S subunit
MSELNIPDSWVVATIDDVTDNFDGTRVPLKSTDREKRQGPFPYYGASGIIDSLDDYLFDGEYLLVSEDGANLLARKYPIAFIATGKFWVNNHAHIVRAKEEITTNKFLEYHFANINISRWVTGAAQPKFNQAKLKSVELPLPPSQEQHRIIKKIESCFEKIDSTEQNLNKAESLLSKYRESLLAKAFRGELIPQDSNDEPASVLLEKIRTEREKNQTGKKKQQEFAPISEDEKPFDIPDSWEWVRLGEISSEQLIGLVRASAIQNDNYPYPYIKMGDIDSQGNLLQESLSRVEASKDELEKFRVQEGDFLFNTRNSQKLVGKSCSIIRLEDANTLFNNNIMRIRFFDGIDPSFLSYAFRSNDLQRQLKIRNQGTTNVSAIYARDLNTVSLAIPPHREQVEIIKKLNQSKEHIDDCIQNINKKKALLLKLKESILNKAFQGELVEQIESEGTGQELLDQILALKEKEVPKKKVAKKKVTKKTKTKKS